MILGKNGTGGTTKTLDNPLIFKGFLFYMNKKPLAETSGLNNN